MWNAATLQLSYFVTSNIGLDAEALFTQGFLAEPESVQRNRVVSASNPNLSVATGVKDGYQVSVQVQPGRADFFVTPDGSQDLAENQLVRLFPTEGGLAILTFAEQQLALSNVIRVAIVLQLCDPIVSYDFGARAIQELVGTKFPLSPGSDLLFQMNVRKVAGSGHELNRLLRTGILAFHEVAVSLSQDSQAVPISDVRFATSLMIDVNCVQLPVPIDVAEQHTLFRAIHGEVMNLANAANAFEVLTS